MARRARPRRLHRAARAALGGGPARAGEPARLRAGPAHGHGRAGERPLQRHQPLAAHRHRVRRQLRRQLRQRPAAPRLGLPDRDRRAGRAGLRHHRARRGRRGFAGRRRAGPASRWPARAARRCGPPPASGAWTSRRRSARVRELYPKSEAAVIGPAGERGVLFASIVNNRGRSIGRGGLGTVMGSKKLKALVVDGRGTHKPPVADPERLEFIVYEAEKLLKSNPITSTALPEFGTSVLVNVLDQAGALADAQPPREPVRGRRRHLRRGAQARARAAPLRLPRLHHRLRPQDHRRRPERRRPRVREHLGVRGPVRRERPHGDRAGQLRLQPRRHRHHHHGLHHRLRHGAHGHRPAAGRPAVRRRAGHHRARPRRRPPARASAPSSGSARRASPPSTAARTSP